MNIKTSIIIIFAVIVIVSCGKKKEEKTSNTLHPTGKTSEYNIDKKPVLPDGVVLNGMKINDTTNNLQVILFLPQLKNKAIKVNVGPVYQAFERIIKEVTAKSKAEIDKEKGKNFLYIQVESLMETGDSLKCLLRIKEKYLNSDTIIYTDSICYPKK
ncbi:MAG: hypothetical protein LBR17_05375 [Bacteroidales bacterium]|jgi:tRNA nucleotidyltransferase (CCA-adding enzyme)|nr:hypothetical protein [Bacteroidales bacterium]